MCTLSNKCVSIRWVKITTSLFDNFMGCWARDIIVMNVPKGMLGFPAQIEQDAETFLSKNNVKTKHSWIIVCFVIKPGFFCSLTYLRIDSTLFLWIKFGRIKTEPVNWFCLSLLIMATALRRSTVPIPHDGGTRRGSLRSKTPSVNELSKKLSK